VTTTTRRAEVDAYLAGVAAALADLAPDDRQDLLDELSTHLDELSRETDAPLESRLGMPADYAAELRASAGLPPGGANKNIALVCWARLRTALDRPGPRAVREFLVSLRPVWWVARAWVLVATLSLWTEGPRWLPSLIVVPRIVNGTAGLCLTLVAIVSSIELARHQIGAEHGARNVSLLVNTVALLLLLPTLLSVVRAGENAALGAISYQTIEQAPTTGVYAHGERLSNIYSYDGAGKLVSDLRLFDEHGRPLDLDMRSDANRRVLFDSTGAAVQNTYPIRYFQPGTRTVTNPSAAPAIVVPPLVAQPMAAPGATVDTSSPSPTASAKR
jgi:hypothetical protein